jgi:hypothetical protein
MISGSRKSLISGTIIGATYGRRNCQKLIVSVATNLQNGPDLFLDPEIVEIDPL